MFTRKQLERLISKRSEEVVDSEKKCIEAEKELAERRAYLQALTDLLKLCPVERTSEDQASDSLREGSLMAQARDAIKAAAKPLHINEIMKTIGVEITPNSKTSLAGSISGYVRKSKIFTRPKANTFGLTEFNADVGNEPEPGTEEPPSNVVNL